MLPTHNAETNIKGRNHQNAHGITIFLPAISLKAGSNAQANIRPSINEIRLKRRDSIKNCATRLLLNAPTVFRKPTSLALLADFAVERLIKLIMAWLGA